MIIDHERVCGNCIHNITQRQYDSYFAESYCNIDGHCISEFDFSNHECKEWQYAEEEI